MKKISIIFCLITMILIDSKAQEYSLDDCISIAIENNFDIRGAILVHENARLDEKIAKSGKLPSLDINYNIGQNYGRSIDPFTNDYVNQELTFSNVRLNADLLLYNGFRVKHEISQANFAQSAANLERKELEDNLKLVVTRAYLEVLNIRTILNLSRQRVESTKMSLEQVQKEFEAGSGDPAALYDFRGQFASDQLRVVDAENLLQSTRMALFQLMNIDYSESILLKELPSIPSDKNYDENAIFTSASQKFSAFEAREERIKEARSSIKAQKATLMPSVILFAGINSNFSSAAQRLNILDEVVKETGDFIELNQNQLPVLERTNNFSQTNISYGNQIFENLSPNFGIAINYPIFNQNIQKNRIQRSQIQLRNAEIEKESLNLQYKQAIDLAILNYNNAKRRLSLLESQVESFEESLRINQVRMENGVSNQIEFIISMNNLETAKLTLANAKFDLLLQEYVIEFYRS